MQSALEYFQKEKGFARGLNQLTEAYNKGSNLQFFGSINIVLPTTEEGQAWSEFFGKNYSGQVTLRISLAEFKRRFNTLFPADDINSIIKAYTSDSTQNYGNISEDIELILLPKYSNTYGMSWLNSIINRKGRQYSSILAFYKKNKTGTINMLAKTTDILNSLDAGYIHIDTLSKKFLSKSCELDFGTDHGNLLLTALAYYHNQKAPSNGHDAALLYLKVGIIAEDSTCLVATKGLVSPEVEFLTLAQVNRINCPEVKNVYVVEETQAFDKVRRQVKLKNGILLSPINSHNSAFLYLVDKLAQKGAVIYYSGIFDYNALAFADKLSEIYHKQFVPWRYSKEDYWLAAASSNEFLKDGKKELAMKNETLASVLSQMRKKGVKAGLLPLVPSLVSDIIKYEE